MLAQLAVGATIGLLGACIGTPLGIALAYALLWYFGGEGEISMHVPVWGIAMCFGGALGAAGDALMGLSGAMDSAASVAFGSAGAVALGAGAALDVAGGAVELRADALEFGIARSQVNREFNMSRDEARFDLDRAEIDDALIIVEAEMERLATQTAFEDAAAQAMISCTTRPCTSVRRKSRPL